ncbi:uncharacterized protein LOC125231499 [Leguminivora glycinivorella]|uniref:uncharacterized protein LOC125231499 n=1 Tax=Leguminivora glycinivorella TaxID=1035111 RepID=UPI00200EFF36|nr:uncharacterized protein LOC125231499 [Leguminivora glycinivorella]
MDLQESDDVYVGSFTKGLVFELWLSTSGTNIERRHQVLQHLIEMVPDAEKVDTGNLENVIKYVCERIAVSWKSCSRKKADVRIKHSVWFKELQSVQLLKKTTLNRNSLDVELGQQSSSGSLPATGRPKKEFAVCSKRSQHRISKFFKHPSVSAEITGIQQDLIERCGTILECYNLAIK